MRPIEEVEIWIEKPVDTYSYEGIYTSYRKAVAAIAASKTPECKLFWREMANRLLQRLRVVCDLIFTEDSISLESIQKAIEEAEKREFELSDSDEEDEINCDYYIHSPKIRYAVDMVICKIKEVPAQRMIIFSAFVTVLNALQRSIETRAREVRILRYTGDLSARKRDEVVSEFTSEKLSDPTLLLITIGSGNTGLNLVPCATVILMDVSINPFEAKQAVSRVHRVTQREQVRVYSLIMKDMVEETIRQKQNDKLSSATAYKILL